MKKRAYRHGETLLVKIDKLPEDLKPITSHVFMVGSHGNNHSIDTGTIYLKNDGMTFGYLEAKNTSLLHPEHSPNIGDAKIEDGYYQLIKQQEYTPDGLIPVQD